MNSPIHAELVSRHIQDLTDEAAAARLAREVKSPRRRLALRWKRTLALRPTVVRNQTG